MPESVQLNSLPRRPALQRHPDDRFEDVLALAFAFAAFPVRPALVPHEHHLDAAYGETLVAFFHVRMKDAAPEGFAQGNMGEQ